MSVLHKEHSVAWKLKVFFTGSEKVVSHFWLSSITDFCAFAIESESNGIKGDSQVTSLENIENETNSSVYSLIEISYTVLANHWFMSELEIWNIHWITCVY